MVVIMHRLVLALAICSIQISIAGAYKCYSCTNYDADKFTLELRDPKWAKWLRTIPSLTRSQLCVDEFDPDDSVRAHARNCDGGVCLKITVYEQGKDNHVLRTCLMNAADQFQNECVTETNSKGDLKICTCSGELCNSAPYRGVPRISGLVIFSILLLTAQRFRNFG